MADSEAEDVKKINEIIQKHKIEGEDPNELEYAEFIDYTNDNENEADETVEIEDYEIPDFSKSDISKFPTYKSEQFLTENEKRIIESCSDPILKQLLLLNRNKNIQLMQLYKKIRDLLEECHQNIFSKEKIISTAKSSKRIYTRIWRLGFPYFKTKDDFPCPRNEDTIRKHNNGELLFYDMTASNKWLEKDTNRLLKGIAFHYKITRQFELEKRIKELEKNLSENPDAQDEVDLIQELKNNIEDIRNSKTELYPPLGSDSNLDWNRIADNFLRERYSAQDCQIFWNTYLHPQINKGPWTWQEDLRLKTLAMEYNSHNWDLIAAELGNNRTGFIACMHYFRKIEPPGRGRFTKSEDKLLCDLVAQNRQGDYIPWSKITHHFTGRTRGQLFYRYKYFLNGRIGKSKGKFSEAEDILILVLVDKFGHKFAKCGQYFFGRSTMQIKARYTSNLRGAIKKGSFTVEEDEQILKYANDNGSNSWEYLVKHFGRCAAQIRQRYKTLANFLELHPGAEVAQAPRRKYNGLPHNIEFDFLRCIADKFKKCQKIPTLRDIERLLQSHPPVEPLRKKKLVQQDEICAQHKGKPLAQYTNKHKPKESKKIATKSENYSDDDNFSDMSFSVDNLLVDFFSNSMKLNIEQNVDRQHIQKAAATVISTLSTLQVELHIPKHFIADNRLDTLDVYILNILTENRPVNARGEFVISRNSLHIDRLIPPNVNTVVGMRSLLIKNQIYKSKHSKRAYIFESFKMESKEKQVLWCINNHLSNQSQDTQNTLMLERGLFFKRFVSLFKFPAIMTLQKPSNLLESTFKAWKENLVMGVKTYKKKCDDTLIQECKDPDTFEAVFIKQHPQEWDDTRVNTNEGNNLQTEIVEVDPLNFKDKAANTSKNVCPSTKPPSSGSVLKPNIVELLKKRIYETLDELSSSPPPKKYYNSQSVIAKRNPPVITRAMYPPKPKVIASKSGPTIVNSDQTKSKSINIQDVTAIKSESMTDIDPVDSEACTSCHMKLVLEKDSPKVEQLKRKVNDTTDVLESSSSPRKFYKYEPIRLVSQTPLKSKKTKAAPSKTGANTVSHGQRKNKSARETVIKTENLLDVDFDDPEACSRFNLGRGELVLDNELPCDNLSERMSINQDLADLNMLNAMLKKERNVDDEESFDF